MSEQPRELNEHELASKMFNMKLNEELKMPGGIWIVTRVPGGWIYSRNEELGPAIFVPKDSEFFNSILIGDLQF